MSGNEKFATSWIKSRGSDISRPIWLCFDHFPLMTATFLACFIAVHLRPLEWTHDADCRSHFYQWHTKEVCVCLCARARACACVCGRVRVCMRECTLFVRHISLYLQAAHDDDSPSSNFKGCKRVKRWGSICSASSFASLLVVAAAAADFVMNFDETFCRFCPSGFI